MAGNLSFTTTRGRWLTMAGDLSFKTTRRRWTGSFFSYNIAKILAWQQVGIVCKVCVFRLRLILWLPSSGVSSVFSLLIWLFSYEYLRNACFECYSVFVLNVSSTTCSTISESHPGLNSANFTTTRGRWLTMAWGLSFTIARGRWLTMTGEISTSPLQNGNDWP